MKRALLVLAACNSKAAPDLGAASHGAIGDFDGDGRNEIVLVDRARMWIVANEQTIVSVPVARGIQQLAVADLDGDGRAEIYAGWGISREHRDAQAAVTVHRFASGELREETILAPETERDDIAAIIPMLDERSLLVAYFASKFMVTSVVVKDGATKPLATIRMATSYARGDVDNDGVPDIVVGRVYGDAKDTDGDAFVLGLDGSRRPIPTTRGVRSLAIAGGAIYMGDGWHQNYGEQARGLVTRATWNGSEFTSELVEDTQGQYSIDRIVTVGDAVVTLGNKYVRAFRKRDGTWRGKTLSGPARDLAVGDLGRGPRVLVVGEKSEIVRLPESW